MKQNLVRESNIELLRIISMFMVLALHVNGAAILYPKIDDVISMPAQSFMRFLNTFLCIDAVNIYILISGWFGIKYKKKGFLSLIFQCLFFSISIYALFAIIGQVQINRINIMSSFFLMYGNAYWFVWCYLVLYLLAPVLNSFTENTDKETFKRVLISLFIVQTILSIFTLHDFYKSGYSPLSFINLYLLARYFSIYRIVPSKMKCLIGFLCCVIINTLLSFLPMHVLGIENSTIPSIAIAYINPLNIAGALFILLLFIQFKFKSRIINWISASCFAVYLLHSHFCIYEYFTDIARYIYNNYNGIGYYFIIITFMTLTFIISIFIDKIRIACFNLLSSKLRINT